MGRLDGKVALITGGGSGLGRGIAQRYVEEGAHVLLTDINADSAAESAETLGCQHLPQDVADEAAWKSVVDAVQKQFGRMDVLVNNAGIFSNCAVEDTPLEQWQRVLDVNLTGVFLCTQAAFRVMKQQDPMGGRIINNGSVSAAAPTRY